MEAKIFFKRECRYGLLYFFQFKRNTVSITTVDMNVGDLESPKQRKFRCYSILLALLQAMCLL